MSKKRQAALHYPNGRADADVTTLTWTYAPRFHVADHFHDQHQLVYAEKGVMAVRAGRGLWVVPPGRAVWIPARVVHAIDMHGEVRMKTLYLAPRLGKKVGRVCRVLHVSPLLHQLVLHACTLHALERAEPRHAHLVSVILDEMEASPALPLELTSPRDPRAQRLAERLLEDPADATPLDELCRAAGASKRTIERAFQDDTGMTLGKWRQQLSLVHGMRLIASGAKVTTAATDAGYESPSAFIAMFKKALGTTPSKYFAALEQG